MSSKFKDIVVHIFRSKIVHSPIMNDFYFFIIQSVWNSSINNTSKNQT